MNRNHRSTAFLKECLADAWLLLLRQKPDSRITADEIAARAGVGRATYFRHFHSRQELAVYKLLRLWERFCDESRLNERSRFALENARVFFAYNYSIRETLDTLYRAGYDGAVFAAVQAIMLDGLAGSDWYRERFYAYGLFGLLDGWVRRGYAETPAQMAALTVQIVQAGGSAQG